MQLFSFVILLGILERNFVVKISLVQPLTLLTQLVAIGVVFLLFRTLTQTAELLFQTKVQASDFAAPMQMSIVVLSMLLGLQVLLSI